MSPEPLPPLDGPPGPPSSQSSVDPTLQALLLYLVPANNSRWAALPDLHRSIATTVARLPELLAYLSGFEGWPSEERQQALAELEASGDERLASLVSVAISHYYAQPETQIELGYTTGVPAIR